MNRNNSRTLLVKAASFLGVAGLSVLISLPAVSQQSPGNTSPNVPSTVKPTNPGSREAGTTNGGEDLNRVPASGTTIQRSNSGMDGDRMNGQTTGTPVNAAPASNSDAINRVEGRNQGSPQEGMNVPGSRSNGSNGQSGANQPAVTTGGDASQQVMPSNDSMQQRGQTTNRVEGSYQGGMQNRMNAMPRDNNGQSGANQPAVTTGGDATQQVNPNSGSMMQRRSQTTPQNGGQYQNQQGTPQSDTNSGATTQNQTNSQQGSINNSVRALW